MATLPLEEKLLCAICLELYREAVTLPCGHNFCRACIINYWNLQEVDCPQCRTPFAQRPELHKNGALCDVVETLRAAEWQGAAPEPGPGPTSAARCPRHGWTLELYCRTEKQCICCACTVDQCQGHQRILPDVERKERELEEQLEENRRQSIQTKEKLQELQQKSKKIQDSAQILTLAVSNKVTALLRVLETQRDMALQNIEQEKAALLAQAGAIRQGLRDHLERLAQHIQQIQELQSCPDDLSFLQRSLLLIPPEPWAPMPSLKWDEDSAPLNKLKRTLDQICQLLLKDEIGTVSLGDAEPSLKEHQEHETNSLEPIPRPVCNLRKKLTQNYRNLTFDPLTANHYFHLSRQNQRVKHGFRSQHTAQPGRFQLWQVLCAQGFEAGKHYWEVEVSDHSVTLGVTYLGLARQKQLRQTDNIGRNPYSWGLRVQEKGYEAWHNGEAQQLPGKPGNLFGMELDLPIGRLSFYSLEPQVQLLHVFNAFFMEPLYPVFWLCEDRTITLCHLPGAKPYSGPQGEALSPS
ncbi:tripartite motif-containing protein 65 isoform X2 [Sarcophilus harrisii]|uniref:tripartite motif-containing protein 65 isoform X2 n=1 Tax=Sarcophilus harrisii TaxID=9305 RepID=UPI001301AE06|nr:tripartite motif-containing protein 65 isoform X2 [Sarcophilus harrisii]